MDMNEWAQKKAAEVRQQREQAESQRKAYLLDSEHLKNDTPKLWNELCQNLKSRIDTLNQALGEKSLFQDIRPNETVIGINGKQSRTTLTFDPQGLEISCMIVSAVTQYKAKAFEGNVSFSDRNTGSNYAPDQLAEHVLNQFIRYM